MEKSNIKVILISLYSYRFTSLGLRQLHQILKNIKVEVYAIFFKKYHYLENKLPSKKEFDLLYTKIYEIKPDFIGLSIYSSTFCFAKQITETVKQNLNTKIIWGGIHPTINPEQCIHYADFINIGEGYDSLPKLIESFRRNQEYTKIPNLWINTKTQIIKNETGLLLNNLDEIPFPDYTNENKFYIENDKIYDTNPYDCLSEKYYIMSSLGCPFSCTYCCNNILHKLVKEKQYIVRRRSVHNVIEELTQAKKLYNFSFVEFWDDVFTMDHKWLKIFSNEYKNKINIPFFCYAHASSINEDIIDELHRAGLVRMTLGVQTGSDKCRKEYYNRVDTNTKILEAANLLRKYHIFVSYDFMIGNPAETDQEMKETFYFILKLPHPLALTVSPLLFFSKHDLTNTLLEKRLISKNDVEDVAYKALQGFGGLIHIHGSKKLKYWNFLYFLAGYIKLPIFLKNIVLSNWFYTISEWIIYPSHYILQLLIYLQLYLQQKYPNIFKSRAVK